MLTTPGAAVARVDPRSLEKIAANAALMLVREPGAVVTEGFLFHFAPVTDILGPTNICDILAADRQLGEGSPANYAGSGLIVKRCGPPPGKAWGRIALRRIVADLDASPMEGYRPTDYDMDSL